MQLARLACLFSRWRGVLFAAPLVACGPEAPDDTDASSSSSASTTTGSTTSTTPTTSTGPTTSTTSTPTTGEPTIPCASAKTEAECALATEVEPNIGAGCRWGRLQVARVFEEMCSLEEVGGVCVLADFNEGGPGCWGFFREGEGGAIELVSLDCGSPVDDSWQPCWQVPMDSPGFEACGCINPDA